MERTSIECCENSLNSIILPTTGHITLSEIQPLHLTRLYNKLAEKGYTRNGKQKPYSARTLKRIHQIISSSLNTAYPQEPTGKTAIYLFIQNDRNQMDVSTPNKAFKKIIRIYNETHGNKLPEITLHGLRHPYVKLKTKIYLCKSRKPILSSKI